MSRLSGSNSRTFNIFRLNNCPILHQRRRFYHAQSSNIALKPRYIRNTRNYSVKLIDDSIDPGSYEILQPELNGIVGVTHIPRRDVPGHIVRPPYARIASQADKLGGNHEFPYQGDGRIILGGEEEKSLRRACTLAKNTLKKASQLIRVGITTDEVDSVLHEFIIKNGAYPSPLGYQGFPKSCCTSVNNIVVHGIPDDRELMDGDIVNVDITVYLDGFHGDTSQTFQVGNVDKIGTELIECTKEALEAGIRVCGPGVPFREIGAAISSFVHKQSFPISISQQFTGHGIGSVFHRPPWILHHKNEEPGVMLPGHCFTIEPALIVGKEHEAFIFLDGWTASTLNGNRSAQAEHTVLITENGVDVLTR